MTSYSHRSMPALASAIAFVLASWIADAQGAGRPPVIEIQTASRVVDECYVRVEGTQGGVSKPMWYEVHAGSADGKITDFGGPLLQEEPGLVRMSNGVLTLEFTVSERSVGLSRVTHVSRGVALARPRSAGRVWEVSYLRGGKWLETVDSTDAADVAWHTAVDAGAATLSVRWRVDEPRRLVATMAVTMLAGDPFAHWSLNVRNLDPEGVGEVTFPIVSGIPGGPDDSVAIPRKFGQVVYDPVRNLSKRLLPFEEDRRREYVEMPYVLYYTADGAGLYFSPHDETCSQKSLTAVPEDGAVTLAWNNVPEHTGLPGHDHRVQAVLGAFQGDWYDGTLIYRDWALKQWWATEPWSRRADVPEWFRENCITFTENNQGTKESFLEFWRQARLLRDLIPDQPVFMQWYRYYETPRAADGKAEIDGGMFRWAPTFSARSWPDFGDYVRRMLEMGMRPAVYSMHQIVTRHSSVWDAEGRAWAKKWPDGNLQGWPEGPMGIAYGCPGSSVLAERMQAEIAGLVTRYGIKGVYSDLAGCQTGPGEVDKHLLGGACWDRSHGHPPGAGAWHFRAQGEMLDGVRHAARKIDPEFILVSETFHEATMHGTDAHLLQPEFEPDVCARVPMLEVVYGDRVKAFGTNGTLVELRPQENSTHASEGVNLAQLFVSGEMIGRVATYYTNMTQAMRQTYGADGMRAIAFARRLSELRRATRQYLIYGRLLRPPAIEFAPDADAPGTRWNWSVLSGAHRAADGSVAFSFANARDSAEQRFSVRIVAGEYGIPNDGTWALRRIDAAGSQRYIGPIRQRTISQTFTLPPLSAVVLVARPR